jgi:putative membrane protein
MGFGWLFMGLFWLGLVALVVWLVIRQLPSRDRRDIGSGQRAEEILDRRFARGEIDEETYRSQRAALIEARGSRR